jgi:hypothetical protein
MAEHAPDDLELLAATARVWELMDPPPADLAEGVLARLAVEDLELELLTLVESDGLAGVRHAAPEDPAEPDGTGSWQLEYEGSDVRIYLRLSRVEEHTRIDGYVVPAAPMTVQLTSETSGASQEADVDEHGRFAFPSAEPGLSRVVFATPGDRPRATPPFWI